MEQTTLLEVRNLCVNYPLSGHKYVQAVSHVSLDIREGEIFALVGESGCGKSTFGKALLRLVPASDGTVCYRNTSILKLSPRKFRPFRREMQMVFQDPYASLDPRMTIEQILEEPLSTYHMTGTKTECQNQIAALLEDVGLPASYAARYPHQLSGGQRQRVGIARAIALNPSFLVCDEPVSALDISVQNQILNLLKDLRQARRLTYLFISHDLSVVRYLSDRTCVMFLGTICELGDTEAIYNHPLHPYTRFLLDSIPEADPRNRRRPPLLYGEAPSPLAPPSGCRFHTRCPYATEKCSCEVPQLHLVGERMVACHLL